MKQKILILGGGFGGIYTAMELEERFKHQEDVEITLVSEENFLLFTPLLHEVASGELDPGSIVNPIHRLLKKARFLCGKVESIHLNERCVTVSHGVEQHTHELSYDHLVISLGSVTHTLGVPGIQRAFMMRSLSDALSIRNHVIGSLEEADFECCADKRDRLLTFVIAGGGFAGVETAAALNDFIQDICPHYPRLTNHKVRIVIVQSGKALLPELGSSLGNYTGKLLIKRGVEIHYGAKVISYDNGIVSLSTGVQIDAATLVWTAGNGPSPVISKLPCEMIRGRIKTNEFLQIPNWHGVWALGDCALIPTGDGDTFHPPTAQHAVREAKTLAQNIGYAISGEKLKPFRFRTLGQLASLGRRRGVAQMFGFHFSGFLAWWMWRTVYLLKLPRLERKLRVALDWTFDLFFPKDLVQISIRPSSLMASSPMEHSNENTYARVGIPATH